MRCDAMRYDTMQLICQTVATLRADRTLIYVVDDHVIVVATGSKEVKSIIQSRKAKTSRVSKLLAMGADAANSSGVGVGVGIHERAGRMSIDIEWESNNQ